MSQALYRKWRPARFDDVVGQEHITRTLQRAIAAGRIGHAYLFCGPRGTGKTTSARLLAKAVNCLHDDPTQRPCDACHACRAIADGRFLDLIEIDAASNTGVDDIRDLRDRVNFSPGEGRYKVYIIDEVHMLSTAAFNALLKTLEEPPPHAIFVLATTEEHKVPVTIKSRCQQFNFRLLTTHEITHRLQWLAGQESLTVQPEALAMIAQQGQGSLRDAESLLDQLVTAPGDAITLERAQMVLGTASTAAVHDLAAAVLDGNGPAGLHTIHEALNTGADARQFGRQMVAYLRQLLLLQTAGSALALDVPAEQQANMVAQARRAQRPHLIETIKRFNEAAITPSNSWQPQLPLELAFIESLPATNTPPIIAEPPQERAPAIPSQPETPKSQIPNPNPPLTIDHSPRYTGDNSPPSPNPSSSIPASSSPPPSALSPQSSVLSPHSLTLDKATTNWRDMVGRIAQQNRNLSALLNSCKPLAVEGNVLVIGFDFPILKEKFDATPNGLDLIAATLKQLLVVECKVRAVITNQYVPPTTGSVNKEDFYALAQELGGVVREGE
jgi:DNA polymerase-3 subunit gamma/tau